MLGNPVKLHALHDVHQRNDRTSGPGPARTPGAVDVAFVIFGRLVQKHVRKFGNINTARGHVCSYQVLQFALTYFFKHCFAPRLRQVCGKLISIVAKALQHSGYIVNIGLGIAKNHGRRWIFRFKQTHQRAVFIHRLHFAEEMLHFGHMHFFLRKRKHGRLGHKFPGKLEHMRGIGGRKKAGMDAPPGQVALYFLHIGIKTDGKHAIGLVKDQLAQVGEIQRAAQQMVEHAARRAHNELCAVAQGVHLFFVAHAAVNGHGNNARSFKKNGGLALYLHGQFPRGRQHKRLGRLEFGRKPGQHGQQVAARFAAARA